jgi:hypothetical protein
MSEFILFLVIAALATLLGWDRHENRKEREKLINTIISRTAQDLANLELAEKVKEIDPNPPATTDPDLINIADLTDEEFQKQIINREVG